MATATRPLIDTDLERQVVSALAQADSETSARVFEILAAGEAFWADRHRALYRALRRHFDAGGAFPAVYAMAQIAAAAGMTLTEAMQIIRAGEVLPGPALEDLAARLAELYRRRRLVAVANAIANAAYKGDLEEAFRLMRQPDGLAVDPRTRPIPVSRLTASLEASAQLIPGFLPAVGTAIMASRPKAGKSLLAMNLAVAVSAGGVFLGHRLTEPRRALYISLEGGAALFRRRLDAMVPDPAWLAELALDYLDRLPHPLHSPDGIAWLRSIGSEYGLIIIDTIKSAMPGLDFNDYETQFLFNELNNVATERGTCILALHHTNKMDAVLGSTGIEGGVDTIILMQRRERAGVRDPYRRITVLSRSFDGGDWVIRLDGMTLTFQPVTDPVETLPDAVREVYKLIEEAPDGVTYNEIAAALGLARPSIIEAINILLSAGLAVRERRNGRIVIIPSRRAA